jgi:hypothetical protein
VPSAGARRVTFELLHTRRALMRFGTCPVNAVIALVIVGTSDTFDALVHARAAGMDAASAWSAGEPPSHSWPPCYPSYPRAAASATCEAVGGGAMTRVGIRHP